MKPPDTDKARVLGHLIQDAYGMWDDAKKQSSPHDLVPLPPNNGALSGGYRFAAWIQMADFAFGSQEKRFYGFIAAGPNALTALVIRGTEGWIEWYDDAVAWLTPFRQVPDAGLVSTGFDKIYSTLQVVRYHPDIHAMIDATNAPPQPLSGSFVEQVDQVLDGLVPTTPMVSDAAHSLASVKAALPVLDVTGHSLGGALGTLYAMAHSEDGKYDIATVCTFASPRVGNTAFVGRFDRLPFESWRIVNDQDIVPKVPPHVPVLLDYQHVDTAYAFSSDGMTKFSPACWHDMATYLHYLSDDEELAQSCKLGSGDASA
jgi:hypothetical protein